MQFSSFNLDRCQLGTSLQASQLFEPVFHGVPYLTVTLKESQKLWNPT